MKKDYKVAVVIRTMDRLGFAESTQGTQYIRDAVDIASGQYRTMMCKDVYPAIAKKYGITPAAAERAIRTAIDCAQHSPVWAFHWKEIGGWGQPSNSEVIMRLLREARYFEDGLSD